MALTFTLNVRAVPPTSASSHDDARRLVNRLSRVVVVQFPQRETVSPP